ncbi:hypothetical protein HY968_01640 [Candidatus Kaiserbacteria bacterium]|nr:hypothetical protein [Candidatus Kaiserbacteria bacterium]
MKACAYCGNNPVPHALVWIDTTLMVGANELSRSRFGQGIPFNLSTKASDAFAHWLVRILVRLKIMRVVDDIKSVRNDRGRVLWEEAKRRGISFFALSFLGSVTDAYLAEVKGKKIMFNGLPKPPSQKAAWDFWIDDKAIVKKKLEEAGIPVPRGGSACTWADAKKIFARIDKPVIVKPRLGSRGRHTTTNIVTLQELKAAYKRGKQLCFSVVIEEHLVGSVYRSTLIDGTSVGILRGDPPRVTGDGVSTIAELVTKKNASKHSRVAEVVLSDIHDRFLTVSGLSRESVLPAGHTIDLIEKIGISYGGNSADDTSNIHPDTVRILENAAVALGDSLVGIDFIIPNIEASPRVQKWGITECNACPFIDLHHDPVEGKSRNAASAVWDMVERRIDEF